MNKPEQRFDVVDVVAVKPLDAATADAIDEEKAQLNVERHIALKELLAALRAPIKARELSDTPEKSNLRFFDEDASDD